MSDKILMAADEIAKIFNETTEWLDPKRAAVVKILKEIAGTINDTPGLKMVATFENGISVKNLPNLHEVIETCGGTAVFIPQSIDLPSKSPTKPYLEKLIFCTEYNYNPEYGDDKVCTCGHPYYRHFDTYENMRNIGCKYCRCSHFEEVKPEAD